MISTLYRLFLKKWTSLGYKGERVDGNEGVMSAKMNASAKKDTSEVIKNYHKQAFEYISNALRIDEDDTGLFTVCVYVCARLAVVMRRLTVFNTPSSLWYRGEGAGCPLVQERHC